MDRWTRRRFLGAATASAALAASPAEVALAQLAGPQSQRNSPEITAGHYVPLLLDTVARPLRYSPLHGAFAIHNGEQFFNRPLYGPNIPFRVDGGDRPEFSLYLPGHGGNMRLGVSSRESARSRWFFEFESVAASYDAGRLVYTLRDALLGTEGVIRLEVITVGAAVWLQVGATGVATGLDLVWAFGGVSGRKGKRNGDIGCEVEPVSEFFQMRPEECRGNVWSVAQVAAARATSEVRAGKFRLSVDAAPGATLRIGSAARWNDGWQALWSSGSEAATLPLLLGRIALRDQSEIVRITALDGVVLAEEKPGFDAAAAEAIAERFTQRTAELRQIADRLSWSTPDPYLDGVAAALGVAADAIWDEQQGCVMHGAVAWRKPLAGWRGPYVLDVVGHHDRMRRHLRHWIAGQNVSAIENGAAGVVTPQGFAPIHEAEGVPDEGSALSRCERLLHTCGDVSHNHYDMNLVFFDALLRHLRWTGDVEFAREAWPALERHAAWERRLFRRDYGNEADPLPIYEAYAAIWASDNLQYNGGGATHSSAYNLYLNRSMADLSALLELSPEVGASYQNEAELIARAMRRLLWIDERGAFAESREWLGERKAAQDPAVWTMYQALDSEVCDRKEAWQVATERLRALRKIPVIGDGVPEDAGWQIACSDWQPYVWSLTLLVLAENLATALALFQAGLAQEGYALLRGSLLDAGYRGICPGNFPMSLQLDPHRQESQRDFGDPIGCASRAVVEGLWGVRPNLLKGELLLCPQLPAAWREAMLRHPELVVQYRAQERMEVWHIETSFAKEVSLALELSAMTTSLPRVLVNGERQDVHFVEDSVGRPSVALKVTQPGPWTVELRWHGEAAVEVPAQPLRCVVGRPIAWPAEVQHERLDDPQHCLDNDVPSVAGRHCVFGLQQVGDARYRMPIELLIDSAVPSKRSDEGTAAGVFEPVELDRWFSGSVHEMLTRDYREPRSPFCSLNLPDTLLGGWANFDVVAQIDDSGLRRSGGQIELPGGLRFLTPSGRDAANCCYLSQWAIDRKLIEVGLRGRSRRLHLLLVGTTFPQATRSTHATVKVTYENGAMPTVMKLRSPLTWWPVEQDYPVDDFIFVLGEDEQPLPWRVDLRTGRARKLSKELLRGKGGPIDGGAAFSIAIELDPERELVACTLHCELYGVVLGLLGMTLERA